MSNLQSELFANYFVLQIVYNPDILKKSMRESLIFLLLVVMFLNSPAFSGVSPHPIRANSSASLDADVTSNSAELEYFNPQDAINKEGFSLFILDEKGKIAPDLRRYYALSVKVLMNGDAFVSITARNLPPSKASLFILKFNWQDYLYKESAPGKMYGGMDESLFIAVPGLLGTLPIGVIRIRPAEKGYIQGDGLIADAFFEPKTSKGKLGLPFTASSDSCTISNLKVDNDGRFNVLTWQFSLKGDYDLNGEVNLADAILIGEYFYSEVGDGVRDEEEKFLDANKDGIVNTRDLEVVRDNFFASVNGFNIYRTRKGLPSEKKLYGVIDSDYTVKLGEYPLFSTVEFTYNDAGYTDDLLEEGISEIIYKVIPAGPTGEAEFSETVSIKFGYGPDVYPPHDTFDRFKPYKGVIGVDAGDGRLRINFKLNASDIQPRGEYTSASKIRYYLYLGYRDEETGLIDLHRLILPNSKNKSEITGLQSSLIWDDLDPTTPIKEPLINGEEYAVYISAEDKSGNRTLPEMGTVIFAKPMKGAHNDFEPPLWTQKVGIQRVIPGNQGVRVEFGSAEDFVSPPVRYRVYYSTLNKIDPTSDSYIDVTNSPVSITGLTNNTRYAFLVRAIDSADRFYPKIVPNETKNLEVTFATPQEELGDITPPVWRDVVGVQSIIPGVGSLRVQFGSATDNLSEEITYRIYYEKGKEVSFSPSTHMKDVKDIGEPIYLEGLENGSEYSVLVRAIDNEGNEEKNSVTLTGMPEMGLDNRPPKWEKPGIQGLASLDRGVVLFWNPATDETEDVSYRVYWQMGSSGITDYSLAVSDGRYLDTEKTSCVIMNLINGIDYSFAVRARDSLEPPNEDFNRIFLTGKPTQAPPFTYEAVVDVPDQILATAITVPPKLNFPAIAYISKTKDNLQKPIYQICYADKAEEKWKKEILSESDVSFLDTISLVISSMGIPFIAVVRKSSAKEEYWLEVLQREPDGIWKREIVYKSGVNGRILSPSMAVSENGRVGLAFLSENPSREEVKLYYAELANKVWNLAEVTRSPLLTTSSVNNITSNKCALGYGVFDFEGLVKERATIAFLDGSEGGSVKWAFQAGGGSWITWNVEQSVNAYSINLSFWEERLPSGNFIDWPSLTYALLQEDGKSVWNVSALRRQRENGNTLIWEKRRVESRSEAFVGIDAHVNLLRKDNGEFYLTYAVSRTTNPPVIRLAVENLFTRKFSLFNLYPPSASGECSNLSVTTIKPDAVERLVLAAVFGEKLWVLTER